MGAAMQTSDVKSMMGITSTANDAQIAALLYPSAAFADEYCNYGLSRYVFHRDDQVVTLASSTALVFITNLAATTSTTAPFQWISKDTVVVWSTDESKRFEENRDYEIDYEAGTIVPLAGSTYGTSTGANVLVDFAYIDLSGSRKAAQMAVAQLVNATINNPVGVASESVGPLSRSYTQDGIPPSVARILKSFRRPVFK